MGMCSSDLEKRDVALIQLWKPCLDEIRNQNAFSGALDQDRRIGEK